MSGTTSQTFQPLVVISFDPGETTGIAVIQTPMKLVYETEANSEHDVMSYLRLVHAAAHDPKMNMPMHVVYEQFRVAPTVAQRLSWNKLPAPRVIGVIEQFCQEHQIPLYTYSPFQKKFYDDRKLRQLGMYFADHKHARDAIRHALYHLTFTLGYAQHPEYVEALTKV